LFFSCNSECEDNLTTRKTILQSALFLIHKDVLATPDPSSLHVLPWARDVAWVACDLTLSGREGPFAQCPRTILRNLVTLKDSKGNKLDLKTGVELEFHLLQSDAHALADKSDKSPKPCYAAGVLMNSFALVSELMAGMEALGWEPYQADHEDSCGQFELNWK
jgi:glutamine synthetase